VFLGLFNLKNYQEETYMKRPLQKDDHELMAECAFLHYKKGLEQAEVGTKLNLNQSQVSKLLKRAKDEGVLEIDVHINHPYYKELEEEVKNKFNLRDVIIVRSLEADIGSDTHLAIDIGLEAARYFEKKSRRGNKVGISGGQTMYEFVNALSHPPHYLTLYPLVSWGAKDLRIKHIQPSTLVSIWWTKFKNIEAYKLELPYLLSEETLKSIKDSAKNISEEVKDINFIFTSVGCIGKGSTFVEWVGDVEVDIEELMIDGVIGDFIGHPINRNGGNVEGDSIEKFNKLVVSLISIKETRDIVLRNDPNQFVILAAGGYRKLDSITACLRGKLCNVLITDNETAKDLLDRYEQSEFTNL
jgi:deoxyribonucleoside regulator